ISLRRLLLSPTMTTKKNPLPPSLVANLQNVLAGSKVGGEDKGDPTTAVPPPTGESKPVVLVTNGEGIGAPGLAALVDALVRDGRFDVHVCAPESDKSLSGHSMTTGETVVASSTEINGAAAFEISGTPADCVSLALSGALFSWERPTLLLFRSSCRGKRGSNVGGTFIISLFKLKDESHDSNFKAAVDLCLPLIFTAIRDIEKGVFPKGCLLNIGIPTSPSTVKGFKVTQQSLWRTNPCWQAVSRNRHPSMSKHQGLGIQLAQLGRDASAAGAARRLNTQGKTLEIESVAAAGKSDTQQGIVKKYFRLEFLEKQHDDSDEDLDFKALEGGFVAVTPIYLASHVEPEASVSLSEWLSSALQAYSVGWGASPHL
ncbi:hypothetical protein Taro_041268, partial [Colocasia esculenta]|nr:hypothetical protein [Colocasia esculenta]